MTWMDMDMNMDLDMDRQVQMSTDTDRQTDRQIDGSRCTCYFHTCPPGLDPAAADLPHILLGDYSCPGRGLGTWITPPPHVPSAFVDSLPSIGLHAANLHEEEGGRDEE